MDRACILGYGVVGQATARTLGIKKHFDVIEEKSNITIKDVASCQFVFITMPTPNTDDGGYLVQPIIDIIRQIEEYGSPIYVIRSTVPPGFANHLMDEFGFDRVVSNPEFLTEATAEKDSKHPPFILLGGKQSRYIENVKALYEGIIKSTPIILTDNITAELTKLAMNSFFAIKVIYANQLYDYAKEIGANYERIREVLERHPFGPKNHFQVWFRGRRGVHGKCLPKDSRALGHYSGLEIINKAVELNQKYIGLTEQNEN